MPSITLPMAIAGAAAVGAGATIYASGRASSAQTKAAQVAAQTQKDFYGQSKEVLNPYIQGGNQAYSTLNNLLGVGGNSATMQSTLESLPGYQFSLDQGLKATQGGYAARGLGSSGGALKGAANYATGLANNQYGNYVGQLQNSATTGANAANALAGYGTQTGSGIAGNQIGAGNAQAGAAMAAGNAVANGANSIGQYYTLKNLLTSQQSPSSSAPSYYFDSGNSNYQNG